MFDVVIIGSGPAGLTAAIYAVRAGLNAVVIEKDYEGTGQISEGGHVDNYPGLKGISGYDLGMALRNHALELGAVIENANVVAIKKTDDCFNVFTKKRKEENILEAKNIIYAAGAAHRKLGALNEEELQGAGVSYCATCDGAFFKNRDVAVVGGGDTALDDALYLSDIASSVTLIHRRDTFRGAANTLEKLKAKANVKFKTSVNITEIKGDDMVSGVLLDNGEELSLSGVFVAVGTVPMTGILDGLVELDQSGYIVAGEDCRTSLKGFYAAGDVRTKGLRQVVTATADGANSIYSLQEDANRN